MVEERFLSPEYKPRRVPSGSPIAPPASAEKSFDPQIWNGDPRMFEDLGKEL